MSEQTKLGGWTPFQNVTPEDVNLFNTIQFPLGVTRHPRYVSKQVVAGVNYRFICMAYPVSPNAQGHLQLVTAFQKPGSKKLELINITPLLEGYIEGFIYDQLLGGVSISDCSRYHDTGSKIVVSLDKESDFNRLTKEPQRIGYARPNLLGAKRRKISIPGTPLLGYPRTVTFQILLGEE